MCNVLSDPRFNFLCNVFHDANADMHVYIGRLKREDTNSEEHSS